MPASWWTCSGQNSGTKTDIQMQQPRLLWGAPESGREDGGSDDSDSEEDQGAVEGQPPELADRELHKAVQHSIGMVQMIQKSEFSPKFPKSMKNKWLYRAQLRRRRNLKRKDNKWDVCWNLNTDIAWRELKRLPVQSNVKGFLWLFVNHALPVASRS